MLDSDIRIKTHEIPTELTESTLRKGSPKRVDTAQQYHQWSQPFRLSLAPLFPAANNIPRGPKISRASEGQHAKSLQSYPTLYSPMTVAHQAPAMTVAHQAPLSMGFSRQEHWNELPRPSPGDAPDPGIKPVSPWGSCIAGKFFTAEPPGSRGGMKSLSREIEKGALFF